MEGTFRKRNGKYNLRVMIDGVQRSFTASTKRECYLLADEYRQKKQSPSSVKFRQAAVDYIELMKDVLSPSTIRAYGRYADLYYDTINDIEITKIESKDLQYLVSQLSKEKSPKTVKNAYGFATAVLGKYLPDKKYKVVLPRREELTYTLPDDKELKSCLDVADPQMKLAIMLSAFGTLRRGEVAALRFQDINPNLRIVTVNLDMVKDKDCNWVIKPPKTRASIRTINMPKEFFDILPQGNPNDLVVGLNPSQISNRWETIKEKTGVNVRYHDLRHYAASLMHSLGVPDQYIMEQGGWKSDNVLKSVYRNTLKDKRSEFRKTVTNYFSDTFFDAQNAK